MTVQTRPWFFAGRSALRKREGETRTLTYLVCGIRGLTVIAESFRDDPASFLRLLERVLAPLTDAVIAHRGTIERIGGEGFSAFWNAPLDDPEHAIHACEAANAMMEAMARINAALAQEHRGDGQKPPAIAIGIGIATGTAITGTIHAQGRTTCSVVGECAVTAARAQALSDLYGATAVVTQDTRKAAETSFAFLEVDYIMLDGERPVMLYAMPGNPAMRGSPKVRALTTFHDHIFQTLRSQQWTKARALIDQCRKLSGASQELYDLHLSRIARYEANPPGADWDGAFRPVWK